MGTCLLQRFTRGTAVPGGEVYCWVSGIRSVTELRSAQEKGSGLRISMKRCTAVIFISSIKYFRSRVTGK